MTPDATEVSRESLDWKNGALTEAVLEAFREGDDDGMLSIGELTDYVGARLPAMTGGTESPQSKPVSPEASSPAVCDGTYGATGHK